MLRSILAMCFSKHYKCTITCTTASYNLKMQLAHLYLSHADTFSIREVFIRSSNMKYSTTTDEIYVYNVARVNVHVYDALAKID